MMSQEVTVKRTKCWTMLGRGTGPNGPSKPNYECEHNLCFEVIFFAHTMKVNGVKKM